MTTLLLEQELTPQNSPIDRLYCEELYWNDDDHDDNDNNNDSSSFDDDDEEEHFLSLLCKEENTHIGEHALKSRDFDMMEVRKEILGWIVRVSGHHNFTVVTLVLAVNYFDRFIMSSVGFQREKPWLTHLAAVACLSLASKFEETQLLLLEELQVDCKYLFEAKTIKRMELLILSKLDWNMNAVTPLSYFGHFIRRFKLKNHLHWEILSRCETLILTAISDPRFLDYVPSVLAAATLVQTLKEHGLWNPIHHQIDTFKHNKDSVEECCKFIQEIAGMDRTHRKRKYSSSGDSSPTTVLDIVSSERSKESCIASLPSQDLVLPKKCRTSESHWLGL